MIQRGPDHIQPELTPEIRKAIDKGFDKFEQAFAKICANDIAVDVNTAYAWVSDYTVGIELDWVEVVRDNDYTAKAKLLLDEVEKANAQDAGQ